jgi:hypothetical protein
LIFYALKSIFFDFVVDTLRNGELVAHVVEFESIFKVFFDVASLHFFVFSKNLVIVDIVFKAERLTLSVFRVVPIVSTNQTLLILFVHFLKNLIYLLVWLHQLAIEAQ